MFARHSLAWLSDHGWQRAFENAAEHDRGMIERWRHANWPAVVRRFDDPTPAAHVCLGLAAPPDAQTGDKQRMALTVACADLTKTALPITIDAVLPALSSQWATDLGTLQADAEIGALSVRVYGSCAWQALTAQTYVTEDSDIDLLIYPVSKRQLDDGLDLLAFYSTKLPLDGEIVFPSGQAVAWKEWRIAVAQTGSRVLVKEIDRVCLRTARELLATLRDRPCRT